MRKQTMTWGPMGSHRWEILRTPFGVCAKVSDPHKVWNISASAEQFLAVHDTPDNGCECRDLDEFSSMLRDQYISGPDRSAQRKFYRRFLHTLRGVL
jgi:hypothetical protein